MRATVETFLAVAASPDQLSRSLPVSGRVGFTLVVEGDVTGLRPGRLAEPVGWRDPVVTGGRSLAEVISSPAGGAGATTTIDQSRFVDPSMAEIARRDFGGLHHVTASYVGADGAQHQIHLFVEQEPSRLALVGVIAEVGQLPAG
jgi:hypothetical protein